MQQYPGSYPYNSPPYFPQTTNQPAAGSTPVFDQSYRNPQLQTATTAPVCNQYPIQTTGYIPQQPYNVPPQPNYGVPCKGSAVPSFPTMIQPACVPINTYQQYPPQPTIYQNNPYALGQLPSPCYPNQYPVYPSHGFTGILPNSSYCGNPYIEKQRRKAMKKDLKRQQKMWKYM